jgi:hypothetical protein
VKARLIPGYEDEGVTRVISGLTDEAVIRAAIKALCDPEVSSIVIHKPGSHLTLPNGKEMVVGFRPADMEPEPAGIC